MTSGDSDSYFKTGNDNMVKENYDDAIVNYDKAIELNPSLPVHGITRELHCPD